MSPHSRHHLTNETVEGRKIRDWRGGGGGGGGGEDDPQTAAQTLNEELKDPAVYKATMYQVSLHLWDWPLNTH